MILVQGNNYSNNRVGIESYDFIGNNCEVETPEILQLPRYLLQDISYKPAVPKLFSAGGFADLGHWPWQPIRAKIQYIV